MSLLDICRTRILEEIISPVRAQLSSTTVSNYMIMVVDDITLKILSACCSFYDILESGVTIVELIEMKRQALRKMDCIYFLTSKKESMDLLISDYFSKDMYKSAHVFLTSFRGNKNNIFDELCSNEKIFKKLKSLKEFNLDFIPYDSKSFYIEPSSCFTTTLGLSNNSLQSLIYGIYTFCKTIGITSKPLIRYQNNLNIETNSMCRQIADKINKLFMINPDKKISETVDSSCIMLLLDRSFDSAPLYIHDYCYQALAYDLLEIPVTTGRSLANISYNNDDNSMETNKSNEITKPSSINRSISLGNSGLNSSKNFRSDSEFKNKGDDSYEYYVTNSSGLNEKKIVIFDERDDLWVNYRHKHVQMVNHSITEEVLKFTHTNVTAKIHRSNLHEQNESLNTNDTIMAIRSLPQYQQTLSKYWTHVNLTGECFNILKKKNLINYGEIEQSIATFIDSEGKNINLNKTKATILQILQNSNNNGTLISNSNFSNSITITDRKDRLRLVLLYLSQVYGVNNEDLHTFFNTGNFSVDEQTVIKKLLGLGLCGSFDDIASGTGCHIHRLEYTNNKERLKYFKNRLRSAELELSRYEPFIKTLVYYIINSINNNSSSIGLCFNFMNPNFNLNQSYPLVQASLYQNDQNSSLERFPSFSRSQRKKKIIIFIVGSLTFPEIRCIYEICRETSFEVYIGGLSITTPNQLIEQIL
ncbi:Sec1 family protein [Cryptosporidium serpentis]